MTFPLLTAHTGCMGTAANSLDSMEAGIRHGADIIEDDIRVTADGVLVLAHDDSVLLADGSQGSLAAMTFEELHRRMPAPPALLEPALDMAVKAGRLMNLDLKSDDCVEPVIELVKRLDLYDRVFLSGCGYERAMQAQRVDPRMKKLLNVDLNAFLTLPFEAAVSRACSEAADAACFGLNIPHVIARPQLMERAEELGLPVYVWTVNDRAEMERCAALGVKSITTLDVDLLQEVKNSWGERGCNQ